MPKKLLISILVFGLFVFCANGQIYPELKTVSKKTLENKDKTSFTIKCNIDNSEVYINGRYQGRTDLTLTNFTSGTYKMEVRKKGYQTAYYSIDVRSGYSLTYEINLEKLFGHISLLNVPKEADVYIDGNYVESRRNKVDEGTHTVTVKKFGYKDLHYKVNVGSLEIVELEVKLVQAPFEISALSLSREMINPQYSGSLSKTEMSFSVTADGEVEVYVKDENNNIKWNCVLNNFYTWNNYISWNGTDNNGNVLPDGNYIAGIKTASQYSEVPVKIDTGLALPLVGFTPSGTAVGTLPMAYHSETSFIMPFASYKMNVCFGEDKTSFAPSPVTGGILWGLGKWGEAGFSLQGFSFADDFVLPFGINLLFRATAGFEMGEDSGTFWNFTFITRYGLSTVPQFSPFGVDNGNGFGIGFASGIDSRKWYAGFSSEFIQGAGDGDLSIRNYVLKNGFSYVYKPVTSTSLGFWTAMHSSIGMYEKPGVVNLDNYFCRGLEGGFEAKFCPGHSGFLVKSSVSGMYIIKSNLYFSADLCLSYLF